MGDDVKIDYHPDRIGFGHPICGFEISLSYREYRRLGVVACPNCRSVLMTHAEMVTSMDEGLKEAAKNPNRREREIAEQSLARTRHLLLHG